MKHAISLAEKGNQVFPNPKVGALILKNDEVVAAMTAIEMANLKQVILKK